MVSPPEEEGACDVKTTLKETEQGSEEEDVAQRTYQLNVLYINTTKGTAQEKGICALEPTDTSESCFDHFPCFHTLQIF